MDVILAVAVFNNSLYAGVWLYLLQHELLANIRFVINQLQLMFPANIVTY